MFWSSKSGKKNKSNPKAPRFFCESCGLEVPRDADRCSNCGKYFASIRCPSCDFIGGEDLFREGCPVCGYSAAGAPSGKKTQSTPEARRPAGALPVWVYILTAAVFTAVMAALFLRVF